MEPKRPNAAPRDDAEEQPESGYPGGRLKTKPSADLEGDADDGRRADSGSEANFDEAKLKR